MRLEWDGDRSFKDRKRRVPFKGMLHLFATQRQRTREKDESSRESDSNVENLFFYSIPKLWEFKQQTYFCPVPLICCASFITPRYRKKPFQILLVTF